MNNILPKGSPYGVLDLDKMIMKTCQKAYMKHSGDEHA
jgi:hypothetical protein